MSWIVSRRADSPLRAALPDRGRPAPRRDAEEPDSRSGGQAEIAERSRRQWQTRKRSAQSPPSAPRTVGDAAQIRMFCAGRAIARPPAAPAAARLRRWQVLVRCPAYGTLTGHFRGRGICECALQRLPAGMRRFRLAAGARPAFGYRAVRCQANPGPPGAPGLCQNSGCGLVVVSVSVSHQLWSGSQPARTVADAPSARGSARVAVVR